MANTFSQINIHIVYAVKGRQSLLSKTYRKELYKYLAGIIKNKGQKVLAINGTVDHIHLLISMTPDLAISDLIRDVKRFSTSFVNQKKWTRGKFYWQEGFGAFSYSNSQIPDVIKYIEKQEEHHRIHSFREEYLKLLKNFNIEYDEKYLFDWIEEI